MEGIGRASLITAAAPMAWGSTYFVTAHLLPTDRPLFGAAVRALPIGLVILAFTRRRPRGWWWLKASILGLLNIGAFFVCVYITAQQLPSGVASTLTAFSPLVMMLLAWPLLHQRPRVISLSAACVGLLGVALLVTNGGGDVHGLGITTSLAAMAMASLGFILVKRWTPPVPLLAFTAWQLVAGGLLLLPLAFLVEGRPPALDPAAIGGFTYLAVVSTGLAYAAWFHGLTHLEPGAVALIGLLNPVVGTTLGVVLGGEAFGLTQALGTALVLLGIVGGQPSIKRYVQRRQAPDHTITPTPQRCHGITAAAPKKDSSPSHIT